MYGQALFAIGKYDEAAGAVQHALRQMPDDQWGVVVAHYAELYRGNQDYTDQLRALEAARNKPETDSPAVRFLLGYHYGYLGYPKNAVTELDKTLSIVPDDAVAKQLRAMMAAKLPPSKAEPSDKPATK
jgi:tetratricopeptide (TPR) repeat protein